MEAKQLNTLLEKAREVVKEIDVGELKEKMKQGEVILIDVREGGEWLRGHIPGATHISKGLLECKIEEAVPNLDAEIILHCGGGVRSLIAAFNLSQMGYGHPISLKGGFGDWVESGGQVVS
jgi:rhodanese-related sulfurtransferase